MARRKRTGRGPKQHLSTMEDELARRKGRNIDPRTIERKQSIPHHDPLNPSLRGNASGNISLSERDTVLGQTSFSRNEIPSVTGGKSPALDFVHGLMTGNPHAQARVQEVMDRGALKHASTTLGGHVMRDNAGRVPGVKVDYEDDPEKKPSLADHFIRCTYQYDKAFGLDKHQMKKVERVLRQYRHDVQHAHRFELDNDFVTYATEIGSTIAAEKLLARLQYATLPYEVTWIEFDLRRKVKVMHEIHGVDTNTFDYSTVGERLGLLLHRLNDTDFCVQIICESFEVEHFVSPTLICYFVSLTEHHWKPHIYPQSGCRPSALDDDINIDTFTYLDTRGDQGGNVEVSTSIVARASLWGYSTEKLETTMVRKVKDLERIRMPAFLNLHGELGWSRMYCSVVHPNVKTDEQRQNVASIIGHEIGEFTGLVRWIVVVLAMLNEVPISTNLRQREGKMRVGLTNYRKFLDYHRVSLTVPKTKPLQEIERHFRIATRRRAHEVRAHWRTYLHEQHCAVDEHQWIYDHEHGYRLCEKCEAYSRFIVEHVRGDPSLGWVNKQYVVKRDKQQ